MWPLDRNMMEKISLSSFGQRRLPTPNYPLPIVGMILAGVDLLAEMGNVDLDFGLSPAQRVGHKQDDTLSI